MQTQKEISRDASAARSFYCWADNHSVAAFATSWDSIREEENTSLVR